LKLLQNLRALVWRPAKAPAVILMYHRIAAEALDPWQLCVSPDNFARQLDWLRARCRVIPLRQLAAELKAGNIEDRSVAISFDDGYADNLLVAEPLLRDRSLAATFFLTTATLGAQREFWWDELEGLLMQPRALPGTLRIAVAGLERTFDAGRAAAPCDPVREFRGVQPWKAPSGSRLAFYYRVWNDLRALEDPARQQALAQIREQLGMSPSVERGRRTLTREEVRRLGSSPVADIGAHSVTHAATSRSTPAQQRSEMMRSKQELETLLGRAIHGYAYPYGDYSPESAELAREAGFEFACTTDVAALLRGTPVHLLPRLAAEDCDAKAFGAAIGKVLR
jgi:peptidoglycan/xylan/chitin deacetylase (PgdA/CDA1 family)